MNTRRCIPRAPFLLAAGFLFAGVALASVWSAASAHGMATVVADGGTDEVARIVGDIAIAVVRLLIGAGVAMFVVGVARGAFDGVLASVFGSPGAASVSLIRMAGIAGAFLLLLLSFGASRALVDKLVELFIDRGALVAPAPGQVNVYVPQGAQGLQDLAGVIGEVLRIVLYLIGAWFIVGVLLALINGQIALTTGAPGALGRLVDRVVSSLVLMAIAAVTPSLTRDFALAIDGAGLIMNAGQAINVYGVAFAMVVDILLAVFVGMLIVVAVGSGFAAQAGMALGLPHGLGTAIARLATAFALALLGFGVIGLANQLLANLFA